MNDTSLSLTACPAWHDLKAHHQKTHDTHLRELFIDDPKRATA
ncbi:MAG: hypothetical protein WKF77_30280 [Planctomycetaceae bacterium]